MSPRRRLLLVGGGHAHLEVILTLRQRLARAGVGADDVEVVCVDPSRRALYSGFIPAVIAGRASLDDAGVDLQAACARGGVTFIEGRVTALHIDDDGGRATVRRPGHVPLDVAFDLLSLNIGAVSRPIEGLDDSTVTLLRTKPIDALVPGLQAIAETPGPLVVIGGGAAGVEVAFALRARFPDVPMTIVTPTLLPGHGCAARHAVQDALWTREVDVVLDRVVAGAHGAVVTASGERLRARAVVVAAGVVAPSLTSSMGPRGGDVLDADGFVRVDDTLRSRRFPHVSAAGDVAALEGVGVPKAGVYAVRAGPVLAQNLADALVGRPPSQRFRPRRSVLALIASGDDHATLSFGPIGLSGRGFLRLKDRIDRRFLARHRGGA